MAHLRIRRSHVQIVPGAPEEKTPDPNGPGVFFLFILISYLHSLLSLQSRARMSLPSNPPLWYVAPTCDYRYIEIRVHFSLVELGLVKQIIHKPVTKLVVFLSGFGSRENRKHRRVKIKWPVVMTTSNGLADGRTHNISLGGAFIRCTEKPTLEENFRLVMTTKDRLILVNAEVVWSNGHKSEGKSTRHEMGVRFTKLSSNDRSFLSGVISKHT